MSEWENMLLFGLELIKEAKVHYRVDEKNDNDYLNNRICIVHLDHATELIMKSYLTKEDYLINVFKKGIFKKGTPIGNLLSNNTIIFPEALDLVCKLTNFDEPKKSIIKEFHKWRNEIQHRSTNIWINKSEQIEGFVPVLKELHTTLFPNGTLVFPDFFRN